MPAYASFLGCSATIASVVIKSAATEEAFCSANAHDLCRVDDAGLDEVGILLVLRIPAVVGTSVLLPCSRINPRTCSAVIPCFRANTPPHNLQRARDAGP